MRDIKFRAWDRLKKRYWTQIEMNEIGGFYYTYGVSPDVVEFDLQQYTGLKDKNGKEIYEGDITDRGVIEFYENLGYDGGGASHPGFYWDEELQFHCDLEDTEVIGNIYENPDLLLP